MSVITSMFIIFLLVICFFILLKHSKHPAGFIGYVMMRLWNLVYLPMVKWSFQLFSLTTQEHVLDIGVGNGASTTYIKQQLKEGNVTGIDLSEDAINAARKRNKTEDIDFKVMDVHQLLFKSETFDLVTAFQTHFHWTDLDSALCEIRRVLKPQGVLLLASETVKNNYYLPELKEADAFLLKMKKLDFTLTTQSKTSQWTLFIFQKNNF